MDADGIRDIGVFTDFDESQRACIAGACSELEVEGGTTLTEQGENGYALFAVTSGTADVLRDGQLVRTLGPGDVFGEIAVFVGGQRTATVVSTAPMRLVMLFNGELARLDREVPEVGKALRASVAERLERDQDNAPSLS